MIKEASASMNICDTNHQAGSVDLKLEPDTLVTNLTGVITRRYVSMTVTGALGSGKAVVSMGPEECDRLIRILESMRKIAWGDR